MAESSTFGKFSNAEIQEIIGNAIPETAESRKCHNYLNYLEFDTKHLIIERACK